MFTVHLLNCILLLFILIQNKARDDEISFNDIKKVGEGECALFVTMLSLLPAYNCTVYVSIIHFTVEC